MAKIRATFLGVRKIGIMVFCGPYAPPPPILGNYIFFTGAMRVQTVRHIGISLAQSQEVVQSSPQAPQHPKHKSYIFFP